MGGSPRSLDPYFDTFPYNTAVTDLTNEALLKWSPDFSKIETELADAMPEQPDPQTFTFKLKKGVKFHDTEPANGREFTSADVKYSIERQSTEEAGKFQHAYYFKGKLDSGETLSGSPSVSVSPSGPTLGTPAKNSGTITVDDESCAANEAVQFTVSGGTASTTYTMAIVAACERDDDTISSL